MSDYLRMCVAGWKVDDLVTPGGGEEGRAYRLLSTWEGPCCLPGVAGGRHLLNIHRDLAGLLVVSATDVVESQLVTAGRLFSPCKGVHQRL